MLTNDLETKIWQESVRQLQKTPCEVKNALHGVSALLEKARQTQVASAAAMASISLSPEPVHDKPDLSMPNNEKARVEAAKEVAKAVLLDEGAEAVALANAVIKKSDRKVQEILQAKAPIP